jgi:hypothetical protein
MSRLSIARKLTRTTTPEARESQEQRRRLRLMPSPSQSARTRYGRWIAEFKANRLPEQPYPLARQYARRFLAQVCSVPAALLTSY